MNVKVYDKKWVQEYVRGNNIMQMEEIKTTD